MNKSLAGNPRIYLNQCFDSDSRITLIPLVVVASDYT